MCVSAYMPTDYGDNESFENCVSICSKINVLYEECDAVHLIVAENFNCPYCRIGSKSYEHFDSFVCDNYY